MQHLQTVQIQKLDVIGSVSRDTAGGEAGEVAACGIGGDCVGEEDGIRLQSSAEGGTCSASAGLIAWDPLIPPRHSPYIPVRDADGVIEGVMIGRAAYNDPWGCLGDADRALFGEERNPCSSRREVSGEGG